ncbi:hypothetical protein CK203_064677 [Vitis vinifera]|uniref:Aspartic peptidase DDI1-type domain-containing protein n=1 Tax=Vitis vinifera TaxID=29760 RepID=A0A438FQ79_VITVI|nr:hypothetical protein CK203_064677 [Vitis vinifera]
MMIGGMCVEKALLDLGASVNLLSYSVYKQLGLGELKPTSITLSLADRSMKLPRGMIEMNGVMQLTFGNMMLELNIFYCVRNNSIRKKKKDQRGLPEPSNLLATLPLGRGGKKFCLYSMGRDIEAVKEEPQSLF